MSYSIAGRNLAAGGVSAGASWISMHTANPGTTGVDEVAGGNYTREQTTWSAAESGSATGSQVSVEIPGSTTITHWGLWDASTAGTFIAGGSLAASEVYSNAGTYNFTPTLTANSA